MEKTALLVAAFLFIGALSASHSLAPGESADLGNGCSMRLLDYSDELAFVELDCGSPATAFLSQGQSLSAEGARVTFDGDDEGKASFTLTEAPGIRSAEEAVEAGSAYFQEYGAESLEAVEADCDGRAAWGECWAVYAFETVEVEGETVELNGEAVTLPAYSITRGRVAYLNEDGELERLLEVT